MSVVSGNNFCPEYFPAVLTGFADDGTVSGVQTVRSNHIGMAVIVFSPGYDEKPISNIISSNNSVVNNTTA